MARPLKIGDTVAIRQKGRFVVQGGQLYYDQPPDEIVTIETEAELERMKAIAPERNNSVIT
jgi:hypothetical protein